MLCDRALRLTFVLSSLLLCVECCFPVIPVEDCTCSDDIESTFTRQAPNFGLDAALTYSTGKDPATGCSIATVTCDSSNVHPGYAELVISRNDVAGPIPFTGDFQPEVATADLVCDAGNWAVDGDPAEPVNVISCSSKCCFPAADFDDGATTTVSNIVLDPASGCESSAIITCTSAGPSTLLEFISATDIPGSVDGDTCLDLSTSVQATIVSLSSVFFMIVTLSSATQPTYSSCLKEANSIVISDWCFALLLIGIPYKNVSDAEQVCWPNGHIAAPMTKLMQTTLQAMMDNAMQNNTNLHSAWLSMMQRFNSTTMEENWYWKVRNAEFEYEEMPMIPNELIWASSDPSEFDYIEKGNENFGIMVSGYGVGDVAANGGGSSQQGVICQFRAPARSFVKYSAKGVFTKPGYMIKQASVAKLHSCSVLCSKSRFCQSFAYSVSTSDCQNYAVTPLDPAKKAQLISNPKYVMYTRNAVSSNVTAI
uniref:Apple domain-containing protein n=1 Tax=Plectus sambesii TaxID=2011161 RepID=A0A914W116_9BILA